MNILFYGYYELSSLEKLAQVDFAEEADKTSSR